MSMNPGDDHHALGVDPLPGLGLGQRAGRPDPGDPVLGHADVAVEPGVAGAVDHSPVTDDDVVAGLGSEPRLIRM